MPEKVPLHSPAVETTCEIPSIYRVHILLLNSNIFVASTSLNLVVQEFYVGVGYRCWFWALQKQKKISKILSKYLFEF